MPKKGKTVEDHLHAMREDLVTLAAKCNKARCFKDAYKVQGAIMMLDELADVPEFEDYAWPPEVEQDYDGYSSFIYATVVDDESAAPET